MTYSIQRVIFMENNILPLLLQVYIYITNSYVIYNGHCMECSAIGFWWSCPHIIFMHRCMKHLLPFIDWYFHCTCQLLTPETCFSFFIFSDFFLKPFVYSFEHICSSTVNVTVFFFFGMIVMAHTVYYYTSLVFFSAARIPIINGRLFFYVKYKCVFIFFFF